jgi:hypothetical protein
MDLSYTIAAGSRQRSRSQIRIPRDSWPHFTVSDSRLPNLEGQVPRSRVAQLYPQTLVSLIVASYDSQGYGGGTQPRLHTGSDLNSIQFHYIAYPYPWKWLLTNFTTYPRNRLFIAQLRAGFQDCVSMKTCIADSFSSNGSTCHNI